MSPEPTPFAPPSTPPLLREVMVTTAGITLFTAVITALDSSMCTSLTLLPVGSELADGLCSRLATAAAEREPETMAVTSAMVRTGTKPKPWLSPREEAGGWLGQAGVARQVELVGCVGGGPKCCTSTGSLRDSAGCGSGLLGGSLSVMNGCPGPRSAGASS